MTIEQLLRQKHAGDVYVDECKDGATCSRAHHHRLDGWAMIRSWTRPLVVGYEIKRSRQDFLKDNKWPNYLPLCNQLYFVAPQGIIEPAEVPESCGLMLVSTGGARLLTKKKAPWRDVKIPESLYRYILICRARIGTERDPDHQGPEVNRWRQWLAMKAENRKLGYDVKKAIREHVERVDKENTRLKSLCDGYEQIRLVVKELGISESDIIHYARSSFERKVKAAREVLPKCIAYDVQAAQSSLNRIAAAIEEIHKPVAI